MHDKMALQLIRQREAEMRRAAGPAHGSDRTPFRRRTARGLHRLARAIDVTDL